MLNIFDLTLRPDEQILYKRNDPNDPRFGEVTLTKRDSYRAANLVILGCPQDEGVTRNKGRPGARLAPDEIRRCFYKLPIPNSFKLNLFDLGNLIIAPTLEETHALQQSIIEQVLGDGKRLIVLGGGNDISYPDCAAVSVVFQEVMVFNIDAHYDVRADIPRNSGTPYRQLLEEEYLQPSKFYEIGNQPFSNSAIYHRYLEAKGVNIHALEELKSIGVEKLIRSLLSQQTAKAIFWGFDVDAVNVAAAPGVSAPNSLGLSAEEFCAIARIAGQDNRTRLVEFSEVNPLFDLDLRTSRLVATAIYFYLTALNSVV
ncbi:MAG: formimidoylglutamase [Chloroflexi bacterium]|uniref:Formimidoylglutamase n=1 Tax=Candidatus Chlorohelix allophototropha TaxID=3003348 RepID=A0A8T7M5Z5_9CHLR|nr:formimidoylglutamase [Chloroflexota bacterium]WJW69949.1 formimidoylglutamase [Chloroflexota bacterium L227-S17]